MHFPLDTPELPLYPDLFTIRGGGVTETRSGKRIIPRDKTDMFLPSMGRFGLRIRCREICYFVGYILFSLDCY